MPQPKQYREPMPPLGGAQLSPEQVRAFAACVWGLGHHQRLSASENQLAAECAFLR